MSQMSLSEIEAIKDQGNMEFQKGNLQKAISQYEQAISTIDKINKTLSKSEQNTTAILRATIISNTAMCRLKQCEMNANAQHLQPLFQVIDDITSTIHSMDQLTVTSTDTTAMRSKLLYRRAKARCTLAIHHHPPQSSPSISISNTQLIQLLTSAQTDLHQLLSFDAKNKAAKMLLQELKVTAPKLLKESGVSSSSSPMGSALNNLQMAIKDDGNAKGDSNANDQVHQSLKFIHASILDDLTNGAHELLKNNNRGGKILIHLAFPSEGGGASEVQVLALKSLSAACAYPAFSHSIENVLVKWGGNENGEKWKKKFESQVFDILSSESRSEDLMNAVMTLQMRLTLNCHVQQDDKNYFDESFTTSQHDGDLFSSDHQVAVVSTALQSPREECRSTGLNLLSSWLEPNPLIVINGSTARGGENDGRDRISHSKVKEPSDQEVNQLPARKLAGYRNRCAQRSKGRVDRSRKNALEFCRKGGIDGLISSAAGSREGYWRRECVLAVGRVMNYIRDETAPKGEDGTFIDEHTKNTIQAFFKEKEHELTIEEIKDESVGEQPDGDSELMTCMKRCLFATALFVANGEVGGWALKEMWKYSKSDWNYLAVSGDDRFMAAASECASAAAGIEGARAWISSCIDTPNADGVWRQLLSCDDKEVRSGAASAMAKLGLANKSVSSDEGELFALLEVAAGLLEEEPLEGALETKISSENSYHAPLERGIELLSYLSSKTSVKDEIIHGFAFSSKSTPAGSSVLKKLVELSDPISVLSPAMSYSLATIFTSLSVSIEALRREAFEGKEMTPEQYDDLQAMGKTPEERKLEASNKEIEDPDAVSSRIKKMVQHNVPRALVNLVHGGTEATREQVVTAMMRIACEPAARGAMIQQGCLSTCIKLVKGGDLKEQEKRIVRLSQHTIAKLLITTNPALLNTSQCMGSIQPLIMLVRDHDSSDLQKFEALLSLTNLVSFNDNTKQHVVAERGISILSYAMFSNHEMVRRAATEAMSNLVPNPDMILHLREHEKLKVWITFASDFEEHFECARAALGCLAMVTQDPQIAAELSKASNAESMIKSVLECGNLELMHRMLIIVLNLMEHGGKSKELIFSTGTVAFCEAYTQTYKNGGETQDLELSQSDEEMMKITVDLAKEVVLAS